MIVIGALGAQVHAMTAGEKVLRKCDKVPSARSR